jgi:hypothetical protein
MSRSNAPYPPRSQPVRPDALSPQAPDQGRHQENGCVCAKKRAEQPIPAGQDRRGDPVTPCLPARATNSSGVHPPTLDSASRFPDRLSSGAYRSCGRAVTPWPKRTASRSLGLFRARRGERRLWCFKNLHTRFGRGKAGDPPLLPRVRVDAVWEPERMPHLIGVAVGAFADPSFPQPEQSVWTNDKHAWLSLPGDIRTFPTMPPPRSPSG